MDENKIEEMKEMKEEVTEAKELAEVVDPNKPNYILAGLGVILGFGLLFMIAKKIVIKVKAWRQERKELKELKKAKKDALKHPENYVTSEDISIDDGTDDETETK